MTTPGLHERVLSRLGPAIVAGEPAPGEVLRLEQLEARYGVSRTVVREVVKVLESMHVVTSRRRVGVTVLPRSEWNIFDPRMIRWRLAGADRMEQLSSLSQLRTAVEPVAAALAARNATPEHCGRLTAAVIGMSVSARKGDLEEYLRHDIEFHHAVLEGSGNEMFAGLTQVVAEVLAGRTHHHLMPARPEPEALRLHAEVSDAIQGGDPVRAEKAMRAIVQEAIEAMEAMAAEPGEAPSRPPVGRRSGARPRAGDVPRPHVTRRR
jgi:DNA-binding FadR family transcriptional regulator